jgi:hypothetical protein
MRWLITAVWALVGLVKMFPVVGLLSEPWLVRLYGDVITHPDTAILLRHRALYLGITGALIIYAALNQEWRPLAFFIATLSMLSFVLITFTSDAGAALRRIAAIDCALFAALSVAILLEHLIMKRGAIS